MKFVNNIVAIDCETTGLDKTKDYIIQVGISKFNTTYDGDIVVLDKKCWDIQPEGKYTMSLGAYFKHGIKPIQLVDKPYFKDVAQEILDFCEGCDVLTYNGFGVDIPFIETEFNRCGKTFDFSSRKCFDAYKEEVRRNSNTLSETYKRYTGKDLTDAHSAMADVEATIEVFNAQQKKMFYGNEEFISEDGFIEKKHLVNGDHYCFNFGKYSGVPVYVVKKTDLGYIDWVLNNPSFSKRTKDFIRKTV